MATSNNPRRIARNTAPVSENHPSSSITSSVGSTTGVEVGGTVVVGTLVVGDAEEAGGLVVGDVDVGAMGSDDES
ncbi:MAG: hypothetical protein ACKO8T_10115 [Actinomycetota bacterium]